MRYLHHIHKRALDNHIIDAADAYLELYWKLYEENTNSGSHALEQPTWTFDLISQTAEPGSQHSCTNTNHNVSAGDIFTNTLIHQVDCSIKCSPCTTLSGPLMVTHLITTQRTVPS